MAIHPPRSSQFPTSTPTRVPARGVAHITRPQGERLEADTRLVVAPDAGVFEPAIDLVAGSPVAAGQIVGHLMSGPTRKPVVSPFAGRSGEALAWSGERLQAHQPVMWLSIK